MRRPKSVNTISWSDQQWNPWHGCEKVTEECRFCYMYTDKKRYGQDPIVVVRSKTKFNEPLKWKAPTLIFSCSWSDFFIDKADDWRADAWEVIRQTPQHTYLLLTKRPERILNHLPKSWPWAHVWLGASVGIRDARDRVDILRTIPAAGRFISFEPLLEDLGAINLQGVDWAIIGGESGPDHRPMELAWMQSICKQCVDAGVHVFVKQDSATKDGQRGRIPDDLWAHDWTPM